jgi:hypothetical protein
MRHARLIPHPTTPCPRVESIDACISVQPGGDLNLTYTVSGDVTSLLIPPAASPQRTDGLWQHTCFEAFVMAEREQGYREFNFSPSGEWAAYIFSDYRDGRPLDAIAPPAITCRTSDKALELDIRLSRFALPDAARLYLGLSAVVETQAGKVTYWALRHPPGKPDFHHTDAFALEFDLV